MSVKVPYLLQELTSEAEKILKSEGFQWKVTGNPTQRSIVQNQSPAPGKLVAAGSVVQLHVVATSAQGPTSIDTDDLPGGYNVTKVDGFRAP